MEKMKEMLVKEGSAYLGAKVYFREDWECEYFDVAGKYFAMIGANNDGTVVLTIKGKPEENELMREQYSFVIPGYYSNKTHWNSIVMKDSTFTEQEYKNLLKNSYDLVVAKLPKKVRDNF